MAFVNEYIQEADYEKYDLRKIIGEKNPFEPGYMFARDWTIDREKNVFLTKIWTHREAKFSGWAFYWKGGWFFFEMTVKDAWDKPDEDSCWSLYVINKLSFADKFLNNLEEILEDLRSGFSAYAGGGIYVERSNRSATLEIIQG